MRNEAPSLSSRAIRATRPSLSYLEFFFKYLADPYHPDTNKDGYICLTVAENKLPFDDFVAPAFQKSHETIADELVLRTNAFAPFYNNMKGLMPFREAIANIMKSTMKYEFDPNYLMCLSGCGAIMDFLGWNLCNAGDACLIPAPFYPAFANDLAVRSEVEVVPVHGTTGDHVEYTVEDLERTFEESMANGHCPKVLLLTNPNNPTGTCATKDKLLSVLKWARSKNLHIISDEIYARSVYGESCGFVSMAAVSHEAYGSLGSDLHILYGLSKDFVVSGVRVGVLYTENALLQKAMDNLSYFAAVSIDTQHVLTNMLSNQQWVDDFTAKNNKRLAESANLVFRTLEELKVPFIQSEAAMFCCARFGVLFHGENMTWEQERSVFTTLATECKVVLTPGKDCRFSEPGWFRICFAFAVKAELEVALNRIKDFAAKQPKQKNSK